MSNFAVFALVCLASAAAPERAAPGELVLEGTLRELGGSPVTRVELKTDDGRSLILHGRGDVAIELLRLAGTRVRVFGNAGDPTLPSALEVRVERYEILDVGGGAVPRVGVIAQLRMGGQERLIFVDEQGEADLLPEGWIKKMSKHVGSRLWIVGVRKGSTFQPGRFAIIRPTSRDRDQSKNEPANSSGDEKPGE